MRFAHLQSREKGRYSASFACANNGEITQAARATRRNNGKTPVLQRGPCPWLQTLDGINQLPQPYLLHNVATYHTTPLAHTCFPLVVHTPPCTYPSWPTHILPNSPRCTLFHRVPSHFSLRTSHFPSALQPLFPPRYFTCFPVHIFFSSEEHKKNHPLAKGIFPCKKAILTPIQHRITPKCQPFFASSRHNSIENALTVV